MERQPACASGLRVQLRLRGRGDASVPKRYSGLDVCELLGACARLQPCRESLFSLLMSLSLFDLSACLPVHTPTD